MKRFITKVLAEGNGGQSLLVAILCLALTACGQDNSRARQAEKAMRGDPAKALVTGPAYDFSYDEVGRLVSVAAPTGESAQYVYDPAGNILEIRRFAAGTLTIMGFFPSSGGVGQLVTVTGAGFSTTPSQNTVQLNGLAATVLSSSSAQLAFAVPAGATTGPISVTVGTSTATTGTTVFTVTDPAIAITDFSPKLGRAGTVVAISGKGFDPQPINNRVWIGRALASVNAPATPTNLQAVVSVSSSSGKVRVSSPLGTAVSLNDFFILPGTYAATDIAFTGRTQIGTTSTVSIATAGKVGLLVFDGAQGQGLSAYVTNVTFPGSTQINLYGPDSAILFSGSVTAGGAFKLDFGVLPTTGTYTIAVQPPSTSVGSLDLQLIAEATGALTTADGPATSITLGTAQNGRYTFTANPNDQLGLGVSAFATSPAGGAVTLQLFGPSQGYVWSAWVTAPGSWQLPALVFGGTYTLRVIPSETKGATLTVLLTKAPATGTIVMDGPATSITLGRPGQIGLFTFSGNANDLPGLGVPQFTPNPAGGSVLLQVLKPDGTVFTNTNCGSVAAPTSCQLWGLPVTGTYTLKVVPANNTLGATLSVLLSRPLLGTLTANGSATRIQITRAGQTARYTFSGTAGQGMSLRVTAGSTFPSGGFIGVYNEI